MIAVPQWNGDRFPIGAIDRAISRLRHNLDENGRNCTNGDTTVVILG